ncbi:dTDP-4-dehydrorhamnose reductase [Breznakia sp. PF5-3]|uniref:SDR family oxidoreductase n=1 Tax=unclassified Breznakia TaxID=2623764 RepID=UPI002407592D|nr:MULTISPECIES: sugar nucleotide-binding protein [unclassified Breznakia]MDF9823801.1 dTDP-4-dehydrorhamnose reductase [Breznakia sp. PM6-1]MDF9834633.1 dTDP-4-dehydrorhamnose reductase [Breznakia sp. PF5-3]MDF9836750.1 dTDP-4-dehydrorhamnose reductase [Breznakia sp. PFB2-8]MDF9858801.1 dTDP-4-dehydrorhamnose reductase [Breznakia sp. PH5-24]
MKKVAITGANGYLASLIRRYNEMNFEIIPITRKEVDFEKPEDVKAYFEKLDFDIVFHTAANANTAFGEEFPERSYKINTASAIAIADVCNARKKRMIFISTEQCFNGHTKPGPFKEEDELISVTNYGKQKAEVDEYLQNHVNDYVTLRLSWMMGMSQPGIHPSPNIIKNTLDAIMKKKETLFTVNEVRGMTYAQDLADQFVNITKLPTGVYHFSNINNLNTYEAAKYVAKQFGFDDDVIAKYILPNHERYADRFRDYRLDNTKAKRHGLRLSTFEDDVDRCLKDYGWK